MHSSVKRLILTIGILLLVFAFFSSCMTYTHAEAKQEIKAVPSVPETPLAPTKLSEQPSHITVEEPIPMPPPTETPEPEAIKPETKKERPIISFNVAIIPLPCQSTHEMLDTIIEVVEDSHMDIIGFTGEAEALGYIGENISLPIFWVAGGQLVATKYPLDMVDSSLARIQISEERSIRLSIVDIQDSNIFQSLLSEPSPERWSALVEDAHNTRISAIEYLLNYSETEPILVLASLGEPSGDDWFETAENHPYRTRLRWPLVEALEEQRYLDSWRLTHHNASTSPGNTWELRTKERSFAERVDYLFQKGLLPTETKTIPILLGDTKKLPYEQRSAVTGTFIVP